MINKNVVFILLIGIVIGRSDPPFNIGEKLEFSVDFNSIPVGKAKLIVNENTLINNNDNYHITFIAKTEGIADRIYKIRDNIQLWIDKNDFYTHKLKKDIREGSFNQALEILFDYNRSLAIINNDKESIISYKSWDPFSMFYYLRTIPLLTDEILSFSSFNGKKRIDYSLKVSGKEKVKSPIGSFDCYIIKPFRKGKTLLKNQGDMQIWISDTKKRLPVKIQIKMKYGSMTLDLKKIN